MDETLEEWLSAEVASDGLVTNSVWWQGIRSSSRLRRFEKIGTPEVHVKRLVEEIMFPGLESPKWTIGKRRPRSGPDKHKIHSIAKPESLHHSETSGRALVAEKASARRSKLSGETIHRPVPRPGYQQGKRQCGWQVRLRRSK
ncbi:hypothetical protein TIFTF001_050355 [Ficus carica]|uniref:Uncharacterized protein n=1 Tax=Ficus carica TaxID=3494 RepID=A0AA87YWD3_FICCA|nr:hypothetical protein TIFTF001_050355 [Ficus carica]